MSFKYTPQTIDVRKRPHSKIQDVDFDHLVFGKTFMDHMFVVDFEDGNWVDPRIVPYGPISLSPASSVLHYAQSIFEGMKAYRSENGEDILLFRPDQNWERLNASAERMCIPQISKDIFFSGLNELIKLDSEWVPTKAGSSLYIRPYIFASEEFLGVRPAVKYKFMIICCPVGTYYSAPVKVKIETFYSRACKGGTGYAKAAGNYAASLYPALQAQKNGYHQLIWTDAETHTFIEESGTMNVLFVVDNVIYTSPTGDTILDGITRKSVLELLRDKGYKVVEERVPVSFVVDAMRNNKLQEAFGVGTAATISHIAEIAYENENFVLPEISERKIANELFETMEALKHGSIPDSKEWIYKIQ